MYNVTIGGHSFSKTLNNNTRQLAFAKEYKTDTIYHFVSSAGPADKFSAYNVKASSRGIGSNWVSFTY